MLREIVNQECQEIDGNGPFKRAGEIFCLCPEVVAGNIIKSNLLCIRVPRGCETKLSTPKLASHHLTWRGALVGLHVVVVAGDFHLERRLVALRQVANA